MNLDLNLWLKRCVLSCLGRDGVEVVGSGLVVGVYGARVKCGSGSDRSDGATIGSGNL